MHNVPMNIYLYGTTACEWFLHNQYIPSPATGKYARGLIDCAPTSDVTVRLNDEAPYLVSDVHVMISSKNEKRNVAGVMSHIVEESLISQRLICVNKRIYAPLPAIALLQAAGQVDRLSLIDLASRMCSMFYFSTWSDMGLGQRAPILTAREIAHICKELSGRRYTKRLRAAFPYICERAASPKEIELALKLTLPSRLGGMGLPQPVLNSKIELWEKTKKLADSTFYVADAHWSDAKVVLEYDSDSAHLTSEQKNHDEIKRRVLEAQGYKVFTVTRKQLNSPLQIENVAALIGKALGKRTRPRAANFVQSRGELFRHYVEETRSSIDQECASYTGTEIV